jgi:hypothetical protein
MVSMAQTQRMAGNIYVNRRSSTIAFAKEIHMDRLLIHSRRVLALALAALIALPPAAFAQTPAKPAAALPSAMQQINLLFVQTSAGMQYDKVKGTLRMTNIASSTLYFADRPVRIAGHYHTRGEFLPMWNEGPDSFSKNPPNATLSIVEPKQADLQNAVVTLRNPRMVGNDLVYDIKVVEGTVPQSAGAAVLFIDILGVWRRHIRRAAIVGTAVVATSAAASSAAAASAQASAAAASAAAAKAAAPPPAAPSASATQKLEQLKAMLNEGVISQAQYNKASQEVLNQVVN